MGCWSACSWLVSYFHHLSTIQLNSQYHWNKVPNSKDLFLWRKVVRKPKSWSVCFLFFFGGSSLHAITTQKCLVYSTEYTLYRCPSKFLCSHVISSSDMQGTMWQTTSRVTSMIWFRQSPILRWTYFHERPRWCHQKSLIAFCCCIKNSMCVVYTQKV